MSKRSTAEKSMTEPQMRLLRELSDTKYVFAGRRENTAFALKERGFVESTLMPKSQNFAKGTINYHIAFRRTPEGKAATQE